MPFTFSHPAIVLPLRKYLSLTGLVIGSMSPDFEYFIRMNLQSEYSHSLLGVFYFCLPISLCIAFLFHCNIRNVLIENLPLPLQIRLSDNKNFDWISYFKKRWFIVNFSICLGAFSHIFWDSFTHSSGFFVEKILFLQDYFIILGKKIYIFKFLQHASSFIGAIIIFYFIKKLPKATTFCHKISQKYWLTTFFITIFILFLRFFNVKWSIGIFIVSAISAFFIAILISSILLNKVPKTDTLFRE